METNVFDDKSVEPNYMDLIEVLGKTGTYLEKIKKHLEEECPNVNEEWKFYSQKSGWIFKFLQKKRAVFYLMPFRGYFRLTFWMNDKAVDEVGKSDLPENIISTLRSAKKYREGRSIHIYVKHSGDVEIVKKLITIKVHH